MVFGLLVAESEAVDPEHIVGPAPTVKVGVGLTVIVSVPIQPVAEVKVMVAVPAEIAVTKPELLTCATLELDEVHAVPEAGG
jgi:hypothetical protein